MEWLCRVNFVSWVSRKNPVRRAERVDSTWPSGCGRRRIAVVPPVTCHSRTPSPPPLFSVLGYPAAGYQAAPRVGGRPPTSCRLASQSERCAGRRNRSALARGLVAGTDKCGRRDQAVRTCGDGAGRAASAAELPSIGAEGGGAMLGTLVGALAGALLTSPAALLTWRALRRAKVRRSTACGCRTTCNICMRSPERYPYVKLRRGGPCTKHV
eukprot:366136-Chlamydomonas_euryale.AAC.9